MVWDPNRLDTSQGTIIPNAHIFIVDKYIDEVKKAWPYQEFGYKEELALFHLFLNKYDIIRALFSVLYNIDELRFLHKSKLAHVVSCEISHFWL
jgi:hypothetical protein